LLLWKPKFEKLRVIFYFISIVTSSILLTSCFGSKPIAYFKNGNIDTSKSQGIYLPEHVIQKGDLLSITIYSDNPDATAIFNQAGNANSAPVNNTGTSKSVSTASTGSGGGTGYLVDNNGNVRLHGIGLLKAEGMTKDQLTDVILEKLKDLAVLTNPYCVIRFSNYKITVLGEVRSPGVFTLPGERASILEAVGLAGDITDYGLKDRVLLIRENQGSREFHKIDLLDPGVLSTPYFYLQQNDVLYVEADRRKPTAFDQQTLQYILVGATLMSTAAILISLFK
jgi:polysaccharide biosynthesis/export protein